MDTKHTEGELVGRRDSDKAQRGSVIPGESPDNKQLLESREEAEKRLSSEPGSKTSPAIQVVKDDLDDEDADGKAQEDEEAQKLLDEARLHEQNKKKKNQEIRKFQFSLGNIRIKFLRKLNIGEIFLEFEIGGQRVEVESKDEVEEKKLKKVNKGAGGDKPETLEVTLVEPKKEIRILRKPAKRYYSRVVKVSIAGDSDEPIYFRNHSVSGEWEGSYSNLENDKLTVRVWRNIGTAGPNVLIGEGEELLRKIAQGSVDREVIVYKRRETQEIPTEAVCLATFKLEFEELFEFKLVFEDWEMRFQDVDEPTANSCEGGLCEILCCQEKYTRPPLAVNLELPNTQLCCFILPCYTFASFEVGIIRCPCSRVSSYLWLSFHADKWISRGKKEKAKRKATLPYYGTRSQLEDGRLMVRFRKAFQSGFCCIHYDPCYIFGGPKLGKREEPLQGKLDYGYIVLQNFMLYNYSSACFSIPTRSFEYLCWSKEKRQEKYHIEVQQAKGIIRVKDEPRYRQLGNIGRPTGSSKFLRFLPGHGKLYLAVKIVRARNLSALTEYKESLSPSVTVDWAQTRRETRTMVDASEPFWDEWLFFRVPGVKSRKVPSDINDFGPGRHSKVVLSVWDNSAFSKRPLGFCEIKFEEIYNHRKQKLIESASSKGTRVSRYVYSNKKMLHAPKLQRGDNVYTKGEIEIVAYFDMGSTRVGPPKRTAVTSKDKPKGEVADGGRQPPISDDKFRQARDFWKQALAHVPDAKQRNFAFSGIDEISGGNYYLPTFVSAMMPPSEIDKCSEILHFIHSMEHVTRRTAKSFKIAQATMERLGGDGDLRIWSDPYNFLDKGRGDHRDHAILLCNFLLGHGKEAYVCTGRVRVNGLRGVEGVRTEEHVWVMTLEDPDPEEEGQFPGKPFYRTVRFWESSNGKTYSRMNPPRSGEDRQALHYTGDVEEEVDDVDLINDNLDLGDAAKDTDDDDEVPDYSVDASMMKSRIQEERVRLRFRHQLQKRLTVKRNNRRFKRKKKEWLKIPAWEMDFKDEENGDQPSDHAMKAPPKHNKEEVTPYTSIDVIFNHNDLWANLQAPNPHRIQYDLENPMRWKRFSGKGKDYGGGGQYFLNKRNKIDKFYAEKTPASHKASINEVASREAELYSVLHSAIEAFREFKSLPTDIWIEQFQFQENLAGEKHTAHEYILQRLEFECTLGNRCPSLMRMQQKRTQMIADDEKERDLQMIKGDLQIRRDVWRNEIISPLHRNKMLNEYSFHFKHADVSRISNQVIQKLHDVLMMNEGADPSFALAVKINRLPAGVSPVLVLVCCLCNRPGERF
mmetsp:Transcript_2851/g.5435  ORF Transcript_2851/g.5435 Transcript_2851/m.5435 type:complete len:1311 (-) Transcript_2851:114-4046(-)